MAGPTVNISVVPTGGCVVLDIILGSDTLDINDTNITIQRYTGTLLSTPVTIYNNSEYTPIFFDDGVNLPAYLDNSTTYYYSVTDPTGTTTTAGVVPSATLVVFSNYLDKLLFRLFSSGISSQAIIASGFNFNPIRVLQALPLTMGSDGALFPFVVMNLDLEQQEHLQIGEDINFSTTNINIIPMIVMKRYSINVLCKSAQERDFYKDSVIGVVITMMQSMRQIGQDFTYRWQASNDQQTELPNFPSFYQSTIMLEMTGQFNVSMQTNYPYIETIGPVISATTDTGSGIPVVFP